MTPEQLTSFIKTATQVFVWVEISSTRAAYLEVTKAALYEYLSSLGASDEDEVFFLEIDGDGNIYLGRPQTED